MTSNLINPLFKDARLAIIRACDKCLEFLDIEASKWLVSTVFVYKYLSDINTSDINAKNESLFSSITTSSENNFNSTYHQCDDNRFFDLFIDQLVYIDILNNLSNEKSPGALFQKPHFTADNSTLNKSLKLLFEEFRVNALNFRELAESDEKLVVNLYQELLKHLAFRSDKDRDGFYTPNALSILLTSLLDIQPVDKIYDPACGSASTLIKALNLFNCMDEKTSISGQDISLVNVALAKYNLLLNNCAPSIIEHGDMITSPKYQTYESSLEQFDVVISHPPLLLDNWAHKEADNDKYQRFERGTPPRTKAEYAFLSHMIESLNPVSGRMAVVMPHGVLFRGSTEGKIRQQLIEENWIDAVIGLPPKTLYEDKLPPIILICKAGRINQDILFIDASRDFDPDIKRNHLNNNHITKIQTTYRNRENIDGYAYVASRDEIEKNEFNLNMSIYINAFDVQVEPISRLRSTRESLMDDFTQINKELELAISRISE